MTSEAEPGVYNVASDASDAEGAAGNPISLLIELFDRVIGEPVFAHGILMAVAWGFLVPLALNAGRFKKVFGSGAGAKLFGVDRWFQIHRGANLLGVAFTISAWAIMLPSARWNDATSRVHTTLGLVVITLFVMQPIYASLRPGKGDTPAHLWPTPARKLWNSLHFWSGRAMAVGAVYACYTGLELAGEAFGEIFRQFLWGSLGTMVVVAWALQFDLWRREANESNKEKNF